MYLKGRSRESNPSLSINVRGFFQLLLLLPTRDLSLLCNACPRPYLNPPASGRAAAPADEGGWPAAAAETEEDAPPGADGGVPHIPGAYLVEEDAAGQPRYIIQPSPDDVVVDVEAR